MNSPDELSRFGDTWQTRNWYADFCGIYEGGRFALLAAGQRILPWWAKNRLESVRFRPDGLDGHRPTIGTLTAFWKRPGQLLGPYPSVSRRMERYW